MVLQPRMISYTSSPFTLVMYSTTSCVIVYFLLSGAGVKNSMITLIRPLVKKHPFDVQRDWYLTTSRRGSVWVFFSGGSSDHHQSYCLANPDDVIIISDAYQSV
jgi:hypothetical protein